MEQQTASQNLTQKEKSLIAKMGNCGRKRGNTCRVKM
jgi:hypothetical protein